MQVGYECPFCGAVYSSVTIEGDDEVDDDRGLVDCPVCHRSYDPYAPRPPPTGDPGVAPTDLVDR